ncbi:DUF429 domain-containing protein [Anaerobacillus alkaliphilus]|uniref:DUF429 domain-containing protein n=1 Tax=Anaerobacillus alkaliphilus TaxID=1548597 RepID=A0A4Q0VQA6_9BACI|nr:DUF429 domain-containing protein [Anaerobacillus alkaliphilus]RXI96535.1 DUF429 domain-containing protein [Anaerobacillus alkaliphilus]
MKFIGIDLSGPANHHDTVMTVFEPGETSLVFENILLEASDEIIVSTIMKLATEGEVAIGIDAPLSYQDGGGDRPQDKGLRQCMKEFGLSGSSVMPPTLTKMVYLTLRGVALTRRVLADPAASNIRIVEVHPGAAIGTRIGIENISHALHYKKELSSRQVVFEWFSTVGLDGIPAMVSENSHRIDACAAALAAWHWADPNKQPTWVWTETSPPHPFDVCC